MIIHTEREITKGINWWHWHRVHIASIWWNDRKLKKKIENRLSLLEVIDGNDLATGQRSGPWRWMIDESKIGSNSIHVRLVFVFMFWFLSIRSRFRLMKRCFHFAPLLLRRIHFPHRFTPPNFFLFLTYLQRR